MKQGRTAHVLAISGPQTIREVAETHDVLRAALRQPGAAADGAAAPGDIVIDCSAATATDVCFVQLLISAQRSAAAAGRGFSLRPRPQGALLDTLLRGGFIAAGDRQPPDDPAAWCGGKASAA